MHRFEDLCVARLWNHVQVIKPETFLCRISPKQ